MLPRIYAISTSLINQLGCWSVVDGMSNPSWLMMELISSSLRFLFCSVAQGCLCSSSRSIYCLQILALSFPGRLSLKCRSSWLPEELRSQELPLPDTSGPFCEGSTDSITKKSAGLENKEGTSTLGCIVGLVPLFIILGTSCWFGRCCLKCNHVQVLASKIVGLALDLERKISS